MRRNRIVGLGLSAFGLAVAGCERTTEPAAPPPEPTTPIAEPAPVSATWVCDSGLTVAVAWSDPQSAQVTYRDRTYVLRAAPAASGARFVNAEVEWRSLTQDGVERATLSRLVAEDSPVLLEQCSRPAPAAPVIAPAPAAEAPAGSASASPPCRGPQLRLSAEGGDAGAGNRVSIVGVQNVGARTCSLTGYPTVTLQDGKGGPLPTRAEQSLGDYFRPGQIPPPVELAPQGRAYFDVAWSALPDEGRGERTCPSAGSIRMTAPGDTSPVTLTQSLAPCGGRIRVSPFRPVAEPEPAT